MRQKNPTETSKIPLRYFAYGLGSVHPFFFEKQSEFLKKISEWGFVTNPLVKKIKGINEIELEHSKIDKIRSNLEYDIDGLVFKVNDLNLQKDLEIHQILLGGL